jgi:hypothetical protein
MSMSTPLPLGSAPYVSPKTLQSAPTGIDWSTIPATPSFDPQANQAEMWNMCSRASSQVDGYCNQVLNATTDIELVHGPDYYMTIGPGAGGGWVNPYGGGNWGNARVILKRWPVLQVQQILTCPNNLWPRSWSTVPTGMFEPEGPPIGIYGAAQPSSAADGSQAILIGGNVINWCYGRNGWAVQVTYLNGWPHAELTSNATAGSMSLVVNDTTGWAISNYFGQYTGATGVVRDGGQQEAVHVASASTTAGPGTLFLQTAIQYQHEQGTLVSTLPAAIEKACIYLAASEALTRGATSTTIQSIGGHAQSSDAGAAALITEAELLLHPFRRTILWVTAGRFITRIGELCMCIAGLPLLSTSLLSRKWKVLMIRGKHSRGGKH